MKEIPAPHDDTGARPALSSLPLVLGLIAYGVGLITPHGRLDDPDTLLHVVIGRWIIAHRAVPHVDVFTYTMPGAAWVAHEWLGGVLSAVAFDAFGWHGLVVMASLGFGIAMAIFARAVLRYYRPVQAILVVCAAWIVINPHWLARPHIVALPLLVWWMALLVRAREESRAPPLWAALIMIPWVNIHGTFLVGVGFCGLFAVEAVLVAAGEAARLKAAREWGLFSAAMLAATLVTPNGIEAYLLPFRLLDMKFTLSQLSEWKSVDFQKMSTLEIWLLLALGTVLHQGIRLPLSRVLLMLLLFAMSLQHARNGDLLAIIAPLMGGPWVGPQLGNEARRDWLERFARPAGRRGLAVAGLAACAAALVAAAVPLVPNGRYVPAAALAAVRAAHLEGPVLNDYNYGDYLMFSGVKTFVDGRADMFGDPFIKRYYEATHGDSDALKALLADYHVAWTIFPQDSPAVASLDRMPGWRRLYTDQDTVVQVRGDAQLPSAAE
jgi:hypothetical protein